VATAAPTATPASAADSSRGKRIRRMDSAELSSRRGRYNRERDHVAALPGGHRVDTPGGTGRGRGENVGDSRSGGNEKTSVNGGGDRHRGPRGGGAIADQLGPSRHRPGGVLPQHRQEAPFNRSHR